MTDKRKDCTMRHENGNCTVAGGFCTAVNDPICEAPHNAFDCECGMSFSIGSYDYQETYRAWNRRAGEEDKHEPN